MGFSCVGTEASGPSPRAGLGQSEETRCDPGLASRQEAEAVKMGSCVDMGTGGVV